MKAVVLTSLSLVLSSSVTLIAETVTFDLALTPDSGSIYGTGSITLEGAPSATGLTDYTVANGRLDDIVFQIGGQTFNLAGATGNTLVEFLDGQLRDITFSETLNGSSGRFTLNTTDRYAFYYNDGQSASYGTFSATRAANNSPVPEPGSIALLATGLLAGAGELYRRFSPRLTA
ncbi:MAG TPA: PEP-CTERM sorting domain-containing protein [Edaphobacter sp.]|nr:PEP-CTERM sorting domain-containing protein [Edaphobacter sp.]